MFGPLMGGQSFLCGKLSRARWATVSCGLGRDRGLYTRSIQRHSANAHLLDKLLPLRRECTYEVCPGSGIFSGGAQISQLRTVETREQLKILNDKAGPGELSPVSSCTEGKEVGEVSGGMPQERGEEEETALGD